MSNQSILKKASDAQLRWTESQRRPDYWRWEIICINGSSSSGHAEEMKEANRRFTDEVEFFSGRVHQIAPPRVVCGACDGLGFLVKRKLGAAEWTSGAQFKCPFCNDGTPKTV